MALSLGSFSNGFQFTDTPIRKDVVIGRSFVLQCPKLSYNFPQNILWGTVPQNGKPILLADTKERYRMSNGDLLFTHVTEQDLKDVNDLIGGISCINYHNGLYVQSVKFNLKRVTAFDDNFAPSFLESISSTNDAYEGEKFKFKCSAGGRPTPKVTWFGPRGEIDNLNPDYQISLPENILTIPAAYPRLAGNYRCVVKNSQGTRQSEGKLVIKSFPKWKKKLKDETVDENSQITLKVDAIGSGILAYDWFKNGQPIDRTNSTYKVNGNSLTVKNIRKSDFGFIQAFVNNGQQEISSTAFLNVKGAEIPSARKLKKEKKFYEFYILIGIASIILLALVVFVLYIHLKDRNTETEEQQTS
ncbi:contactin-5-like [Clytia hemisphaerica]|uniref:contactin-5-like n=1 Tax=Clytia hemisphaerica TaxID=252671 RepID=UPI0034D603A1